MVVAKHWSWLVRLAILYIALGSGMLVANWLIQGSWRPTSWATTVGWFVAVTLGAFMPERVRARLNEPIPNGAWFVIAIILFAALLLMAAIGAATG